MNWLEVESKIKVSNVKDMRKKIKKIAKYIKTERKIDNYYSLKSGVYPKKSLRVRSKGSKVEVNFKKWGPYNKGIHTKEESEFEVSDLKNFFGLLNDFGFKRWISKEKTTELYKTRDGINLELNHVKKLGWYLEIEALCHKSGVSKAKKNILNIRKKLEIDNKDIEKRGYTKQLWSLRR
jgi:predicted adenylyl cyclase CyaB